MNDVRWPWNPTLLVHNPPDPLHLLRGRPLWTLPNNWPWVWIEYPEIYIFILVILVCWINVHTCYLLSATEGMCSVFQYYTWGYITIPPTHWTILPFRYYVFWRRSSTSGTSLTSDHVDTKHLSRQVRIDWFLPCFWMSRKLRTQWSSG